MPKNAAQHKQRAGQLAMSDQPPFVGALLHMCWLKARARLFAAVQAAGFTDLQESHFAAFSFPLPNSVRPSDFARQIGMSRQAANYLVGQLEALGYLERRAAGDGGRRMIYLTGKGWKVINIMWDTLRQIQLEGARQVGADRYAEFMSVLRELAEGGQR
jgi:DNA-binding MarR family transcriptional regulator